MSHIERRRVVCRCATPVDVSVAETVNVLAHPYLREAILDRTFHRFRCGMCGSVLVFDAPVFYFDWDRGHFFFAVPSSERARADDYEAEVRRHYDNAYSLAPAVVRARKQQVMVRLCFGPEELREKLVAADAGLADLPLEALKLRILADEPKLREAGVANLILDGVRDGRLIFQQEIPGGQEQGTVDVAREAYDEVAADAVALARLKPHIAKGPHVSLLRLLDWA